MEFDNIKGRMVGNWRARPGQRSPLPLLVTLVCLVFFYLPIVVLVVNSFNASRTGAVWLGFTWEWYEKMFQDRSIWEALRNTLIVATSTTVISTLLGTLAAFALHWYRTRMQTVHYALIYTPLVFPDILMGISLLLFFVALGLDLGLTTITIGHCTFCISYVAMVVLARLQDFDFGVVEAAQDLGAGWWTIAVRILLPLLAPGIISGALLAFTLSVDDYVITFFVSGPGSTTLPLKIYSMIKHGAPPKINALSTLLLMVTFVAVAISQRLMNNRARSGNVE